MTAGPHTDATLDTPRLLMDRNVTNTGTYVEYGVQPVYDLELIPRQPRTNYTGTYVITLYENQ